MARNRNTFRTHVTAFLLCLAMAFTLLPAQVFAEDTASTTRMTLTEEIRVNQMEVAKLMTTLVAGNTEVANLMVHRKMTDVKNVYVNNGIVFVTLKKPVTEVEDYFMTFGEPSMTVYEVVQQYAATWSAEAKSYLWDVYDHTIEYGAVDHSVILTSAWKLWTQFNVPMDQARAAISKIWELALDVNVPERMHVTFNQRFYEGLDLVKYAQSAQEASWFAESGLTESQVKEAVDQYGGEGMTALQAVWQWLKVQATALGNITTGLTVCLVVTPVFENVMARRTKSNCTETQSV